MNFDALDEIFDQIAPEVLETALREIPRELDRRVAENRLAAYTPYAKQRAFHFAGAEHRERLFLAGNRCITPWTVLQTGRGERRAYELLGEAGFDVRSSDGSSRYNRPASPLFLRGTDEGFQIHVDNGEVFQCSRKHRVFSNGCLAAPHLSGWVSIDQLIRELDVVHYSRTPQGWKANCDAGVRPCDEPLPSALSAGHWQLPIQSDAPNIGPHDWRRDASAYTALHSHACQGRGLLSNSGEANLLLDLCEQIPIPAVIDVCLSRNWKGQSSQPSGHESDLEQREWEESVLRQLQAYPHVSNVLLARRRIPVFDGNSIIAVIPLGLQPIIDFEVEDTHNYVTAGVTHHNCGKTVAGAAELAIHLTGAYPPWWQGKQFDKPIRAWAAGITGESTRDVVQEKLFGPPDRREAWGTGMIPKPAIGEVMMGRGIANAIDLASIRHATGGWSSLAFKSYEKGREKWQGAALEVIFMDEEPPVDLYYEALTRTNETGGVIFITCTPLLGMSEVMRLFLMGENAQQ